MKRRVFSIAVAMIVGAAGLGAAFFIPTAPQAQGSDRVQAAVPTIRAQTSVARCVNKCVGGTLEVMQRNADGRCEASFTVSCFPNLCAKSGDRCLVSCSSSADCWPGASCDKARAMCATFNQKCKDGFTVMLGDGSQASCAPYLCNAGACRETCDGDSECAPDYKCVNRACTRKS